jgi:hypothetical protein
MTGRVEVDTSTVERSMRPIALGRKNSLFSGSEGGAETLQDPIVAAGRTWKLIPLTKDR